MASSPQDLSNAGPNASLEDERLLAQRSSVHTGSGMAVMADPTQMATLVEEEQVLTRDAQGRAVMASRGVERIPFSPMARKEDHGSVKTEGTYLSRIVVFGVLSFVFFGIIWWFLNDPSGSLTRFFGRPPTLSASGLLVYSSIVALILFLALLLARYFALLILSYLHTAKYTAETQEEAVFLPRISIIVPAYNEGTLIRATIQSLLQQDYPEYEIIVVDDGSTDDTRAVAREMVGSYPQARRTRRGEARREAQRRQVDGAQCGASRSRTSDFVLERGRRQPALARHAAPHRAPLLRPPRGGRGGQREGGQPHQPRHQPAGARIRGGPQHGPLRAVHRRLVNIIPGPLGLFRKQAIIDAGWYSSDTYAEDCDVTLKIIREGWRVQYEPTRISFTEAPDKWLDLLEAALPLDALHHPGRAQAPRPGLQPDAQLRRDDRDVAMAFESLLWPVMNVFANVYFVVIALVFGLNSYLVFWWLMLTILDMIAALYCVAVEKEQGSLVFYSIFYRLFFLLIIDVCKTFALIEEFLGVGMTWGKLDRIGTAAQPSAAATPARTS